MPGAGRHVDHHTTVEMVCSMSQQALDVEFDFFGAEENHDLDARASLSLELQAGQAIFVLSKHVRSEKKNAMSAQRARSTMNIGSCKLQDFGYRYERLIIVACFLMVVSSSFAQYALSPRVGLEIDSAEREYFGLFPTIEGFVSAKALMRPDHHVEITVTRMRDGVSADVVIIIDSIQASHLSSFIDGFELSREADRTVNWKLVDQLAAPWPAINEKMGEGSTVAIQLTNGKWLHGKLLHAGDSAVVLWKSEERFNWHALKWSGVAARYSDIEKINFTRSGKFHAGAAVGALVGAFLGIAVNVSMAPNRSSYVRDDDVSGIPLVIVGAAAGFLIGSAMNSTSSDLQWWARNNSEENPSILPALKEYSIFSDHPPPEVLQLEIQHGER